MPSSVRIVLPVRGTGTTQSKAGVENLAYRLCCSSTITIGGTFPSLNSGQAYPAIAGLRKAKFDRWDFLPDEFVGDPHYMTRLENLVYRCILILPNGGFETPAYSHRESRRRSIMAITIAYKPQFR